MYQPGMGVVDVYTHAASPDASMGNMFFPPKELFKSFVIIFLFSQGHHFCILSVLLMSLCSKSLFIGKYSLATLLRKKTSLKKGQTVTFSSPQFNKSWRVFTWLLSWQCGTSLQSGFPPHHFSQIVLMRVFKMSFFPTKFRMDYLDPLWFHIHWNSA